MSLKIQLDGSVTRNGTRVGSIIRTTRSVEQFIDGRSLGEVLVEGWAVKNASGLELFWSATWGDARAHVSHLLGGEVRKPVAVAADKRMVA